MRLEVNAATNSMPMRPQRHGGRKPIIAPDGSPPPAAKPAREETMIRTLVKAHRWRRAPIECGQARSITDLAAQEGVTDFYVCRLLPLTCIAPDIAVAILDGRQPKGLKLAELFRKVARSWDEQRRNWVGSSV